MRPPASYDSSVADQPTVLKNQIIHISKHAMGSHSISSFAFRFPSSICVQTGKIARKYAPRKNFYFGESFLLLALDSRYEGVVF